MRIEEWIDVHERDQSTVRVDLAVARVAARQHGVVSTDDLRACGLSLKAINGRVRNGRLHPLHRGTYAVPPHRVPAARTSRPGRGFQ
jgi:predicted transcriptional regulator of viral defense system